MNLGILVTLPRGERGSCDKSRSVAGCACTVEDHSRGLQLRSGDRTAAYAEFPAYVSATAWRAGVPGSKTTSAVGRSTGSGLWRDGVDGEGVEPRGARGNAKVLAFSDLEHLELFERAQTTG